MRFFLVGLVFSQLSLGANYKVLSCDDVNFGNTAWLDIIAKEPRIKRHFDSFRYNLPLTPSGGIKMRHCEVRLPINASGKVINGDRIATLDGVWDAYKNGKKIGVFHSGIKIVYTEARWLQNWNGSYTQYRKVRGFMICGETNTCEHLGIPYRPSHPTPTTIPDLELP